MKRVTVVLAALALVALAVAPASAAPPNDPFYGQQWGHRQVHASAAWARSTGRGQVIAIIDSGVDLQHPDLVGRLVPGRTFFSCARAPDGCGNGDWQSGPGNGDPHGTHVAGIAAAATGNGTGIAGVARAARIMPIKVLGDEGGSFAEIAAGIRWAANHGADVINLSLGALPGGQAFTITGLDENARRAVAYATSKGVVVVAAAGNDFASLCGTPAFETGAMCVVATDRQEARASYSNFAIKQGTRPDVVAAPGGAAFLSCREDIVSTVPRGTESDCTRGTSPGYDFYAGTSMATPHVAGVAALLTAQGRSRNAVFQVLKATARDPQPGTTRGTYDPVYGYGIVDAMAATAAAR